MSFEKDVARFTKALQKADKNADADTRQFVTMTAAKIEQTAKQEMRNTAIDTSKTYAKGHHPSQEGNPPAPDTGTLMQSVTHSVEIKKGSAEGYAGSILKGYPVYLEYGTSKMKPRPWLSFSIIKLQSWIAGYFREIFGK